MVAAVRRSMRVGTLAVVLSALVSCLGAQASQASSSLKACRPGKLCQNFRVEVSYTQHRTWTHHTSSTSEGCSRTGTGNGSDDAELLEAGRGASFSTLPATPGHFAVAGLGMEGTVTKLGTASESVFGSECAPTVYFPSTWSIVTETGGGSTATEPATGCGKKKVEGKFPELDLRGSKLRLHWGSYAEPPAFKPCPDFDGANDLEPGAKSMPNATFADVRIPVDLAALLNPKRRRITARGTATSSATENCGTLQGGTCPAGTTYEATGSVVTKAYVTFIRGKPLRYPRLRR